MRSVVKKEKKIVMRKDGMRTFFVENEIFSLFLLYFSIIGREFHDDDDGNDVGKGKKGW